MIFVTVGTSYKFDALIKEIDRLAPLLKEKIVIQTGKSDYKPKNCEHFDFSPDIKKYIKNARLVISHGGAGTTFEVLIFGKKLISVENVDVNDSHQWDLLTKLESMDCLLYCRDLKMLQMMIVKAENYEFEKHVSDKCEIGKIINGEIEKVKL